MFFIRDLEKKHLKIFKTQLLQVEPGVNDFSTKGLEGTLK
ncbi:hypothetical protein D1AOALGA4SA_943 [Olavius algarvensis Delta 1 endosymbiont]|nr:hypothetical protein D1AOALGA4SA_943 [Olavius algarvensis Delta 1 endosymbiont]